MWSTAYNQHHPISQRIDIWMLREDDIDLLLTLAQWWEAHLQQLHGMAQPPTERRGQGSREEITAGAEILRCNFFTVLIGRSFRVTLSRNWP